MYGLTDNIVAGPAGHITAGPAGHFEAGPAGSFTPGPAGQVPISEAGWVPISEGGHVPIDCTPALIPYSASHGGVVFMEGSTQSPIPSASGHSSISQGGGGFPSVGSGGVSYLLGGGGGGSGGGGGGGSGSSGSGGGASVGGGGGVSFGGGGVGSVGGGSGGGGVSGGGVSSAGGSSGGGVSGGGSGVSYVLGGGGSVGGGSGGGSAAGGGGGILYTSSTGAGMPPMELRIGQATAQATGSAPTTPATEGFTVSPGGRTVPTPTGYVHPPQASHFHSQPNTHVAHHPVRVDNNVFTTEAYQPYEAAYVWQGRPMASPPPPFLASDYLKPSSFDPPRVMFADEKPSAIAMVDASVGPAGTHTTEVLNNTVNLDFAQTRNVEFTSNALNEKTVTLDNSETRNTTLNQPENREVNTSVDLSQTNNADLSTHRQETTQVIVEDAARVLNMFFINAPGVSPAEVTLGGPVMARVA